MGPDDDEDDEVLDMRERMRSFAMHNDEGMAPATIFVEDSEVMPSTSYHSSQPTPSLGGEPDAAFAHVLNEVFAGGSKIFQPLEDPNVSERILRSCQRPNFSFSKRFTRRSRRRS